MVAQALFACHPWVEAIKARSLVEGQGTNSFASHVSTFDNPMETQHLPPRCRELAVFPSLPDHEETCVPSTSKRKLQDLEKVNMKWSSAFDNVEAEEYENKKKSVRFEEVAQVRKYDSSTGNFKAGTSLLESHVYYFQVSNVELDDFDYEDEDLDLASLGIDLPSDAVIESFEEYEDPDGYQEYEDEQGEEAEHVEEESEGLERPPGVEKLAE
ncbi:uncharacterized protein VTP21DRAFT_5674 [Calcarisporiella thermophila]|uniref:uncharacterized protein n=1 Tax=Calcarisporiella thermophila TaxID=911321 RepID=UPI0037447FCD